MICLTTDTWQWRAMVLAVSCMSRDEKINWAKKMPENIKSAMRQELTNNGDRP
jgi:hypothetical protein